MKYLVLLIFLIPFSVFSQNTLTWSDTVTVNKALVMGYTRPKIVLTQNDVPVIMWGKASNQGVYVSRYNGSSFGDPVKVTPDGVNAFVSGWAGPAMGASGDTVFVVFKSQPENEGKVYLVRSIDGGITFGDTVRVSDDSWSRFPDVSVAPGGNPFVTYMEMDSAWLDPRYVVAGSMDGGDSFLEAVDAAAMAPGEACDCCPPFILANQDNVIMMFRNNDNDIRDIWAVVSDDGGATFNTIADIDNTNWNVNVCPSSAPHAIIEQDSVITVWMSGASGKNRINIGTADLNGLSIGLNQQLTPNVSSTATQNYPKIGGAGDTLGVVWQEYKSGNTDIKFLYSTTGTSDLIDAKIDTVNLVISGTQENPDMAYNNGVFHFVWQDSYAKSVVYRKAASGTVSINKNKEKSACKIYPNPANDKFLLVLPQQAINGILTLTDITGKIILTQKITSEKEIIQTNNIKDGVYFVKVTNENILLNEKIIIKK